MVRLALLLVYTHMVRLYIFMPGACAYGTPIYHYAWYTHMVSPSLCLVYSPMVRLYIVVPGILIWYAYRDAWYICIWYAYISLCMVHTHMVRLSLWAFHVSVKLKRHFEHLVINWCVCEHQCIWKPYNFVSDTWSSNITIIKVDPCLNTFSCGTPFICTVQQVLSGVKMTTFWILLPYLWSFMCFVNFHKY